jgi:hypothetical protein
VVSDPTGDWQLTVPNTEETRGHFHNGDITDLLLVITYTGKSPQWLALSRKSACGDEIGVIGEIP